ncbi:hypothetical protein H2248_000879 [Termitomyces sp. 'cryptogamus']|nr:hypothetical protein H2248_000879 [Termitomyces sp. 'cryptogamus']
MLQPSVRPSAITLTANPKATIAIDFDALVADWDEYLNIGDHRPMVSDNDDEEYDPAESGTRRRRKKVEANPLFQAETPPAELHTLTEHHDHVLSASFDLSYHGGSGNDAFAPSSSQAVDFGFDDNIFVLSDGLDVAGLADELAQELGWADSAKDKEVVQLVNDGPEIDLHMDFSHENGTDMGPNAPIEDETWKRRLKRKRDPRSQKENIHHSPGSASPHSTPLSTFSSTTSFLRSLLTQDNVPTPLQDITLEERGRANADIKKTKKITRLLLDARTELTDDELKTARTHYLRAQDLLRHSFERKQKEKYSERILTEKVWGVPSCIGTSALADFWQENFKVQVEARTGNLYIHPGVDRPHKRRKLEKVVGANGFSDAEIWVPEAFTEQAKYSGPITGYEDTDLVLQDNLRSSEEPGQGRRISRDNSITGNLDIELGAQNAELGSQKSSMFPWDNAGDSSSSGVFGMAESDHNLPLDHIEIRMRGSSQSRRDSSLVPSQVGSLTGGPGFSPAGVKKPQIFDDDYAFEVNMHDISAALESQKSDMNLVSLERNSFNFLEYVKMQSYSLPSSATNLTFDIVVPQASSTRHVAASAFYHCLVLATKNLLRLKQTNSHGQLIITAL